MSIDSETFSLPGCVKSGEGVLVVVRSFGRESEYVVSVVAGVFV